MAKYENKVIGDYESIVSTMHKEIMNSAMSIQLIDEIKYEIGDMKTLLRVYDKYYMRSSNRASLTVNIVAYDSTVIVSAIGAGGGSGAIFNFSWGAEESFVSVVSSAMKKMGY